MAVDLGEDVERFVEEMSGALASLSGKPASTHSRETLIEASNIIAGVIDADGRQADAELNTYLEIIGPKLDPPLFVTSFQLRDSGVLDGRKGWLHKPSVLLDLLVRADARNRTHHSHRYYALALRLTHVTAALDLVPSPDEIRAIDTFRTTMLRAMDTAGLPRPGQPDTRPIPVEPLAADDDLRRDASQPPTTPTPQAPSGPSGPTAPAATAGEKKAEAEVEVDLPPARPLEDLLDELDTLIGLTNVKAEVRRLTSMLQVQQLRAERGLPTIETSHHLVFSGNPGTGKTTVARMLSQIYRALGVVDKGHLVETDRSRLVAGYVGQTALKTKETLEASLGGMLLIDEAYALARGGENDFGIEAIDTLVKFMEDHRADVAIVAAGYTDEMNTFIDSNPGLKSRFTRTVNFPDYTTDELLRIFVGLGEKSHYTCSEGALARVRELIEAEPRTRGFGNARYVRSLFETAIAHQAMRLAPLQDPSDEQLTTLIADDITPVDN